MLYGPDYSSDDEDGLSDDNEYYEFKQKLKASRRHDANVEDSEVEQKKRQLKSIFSAILSSKTEEVFTEFDKGLDINVDLEHGWTPLTLAATIGNPDIISGLLERGADVNVTREDDTTPLMLLCNISSQDEAVKQNILTSVQLLVDHKANVNAIDNKRRTAIMFAANNGHLETIKFLLPLVDKKAEDNQRWNVLFYAVDGNNAKTVEFLLNEGFSEETTDVRGNTVVDLAHTNNFAEILELFPNKDTFDEFYLHLNNNELNFEETFENLRKNEKPQFFTDICKILHGCKSEAVMPILWDNQITLLQFLSMTDDKLKNLGVQFPFQRNRLMGGLYKFHKRAFKPQSVPYITKNQLYTNIDVATAVLTCIKQLISMEASLKFVVENSKDKLTLPESKEAKILISKSRYLISKLKTASDQLVLKTEQWDLQLKPADRITKKRRNIPWCNIWLSVGVISLIIVYKLKGIAFKLE